MRESPRSRSSSRRAGVGLLACLLILPGCAVFRSPSQGLPPPPELSEQVAIRPDGAISLPLVGEIQAAGLTPDELASRLRERFSELVARPDVAVLIRSFGGQRVYVGGEVVAPRKLPLDASTTVADAVFAAGGPRETACLDSVILLRPGKSRGEFQAFRVNLEEGLFGRAPLPELQPYDVVFVPKSRIAQLNEYVELYVNRIIPRAVSFGATWIGGL
jgi:protein involved in polysaccharide export with SLBB domain